MRALEAATTSEFKLAAPTDLSGIDWAGRTDRWISKLILDRYGIEDTPENVARLIDRYIKNLPSYLGDLTEVLPGVKEILEEAKSHDGVAQGLLTGNMERGAKTKLGHFDLWDYFPFGAFADDSAIRNDLGPHALRRATAHCGHKFDPTDVWIIGDTPHDIECGKVIGARTLAVATGHHSSAQLREYTPSFLLENLTDVAMFWEIIHD